MLEERGLTRPIRTNQGDPFGGMDIKVNAVQCLSAVWVVVAQVLEQNWVVMHKVDSMSTDKIKIQKSPLFKGDFHWAMWRICPINTTLITMANETRSHRRVTGRSIAGGKPV